MSNKMIQRVMILILSVLNLQINEKCRLHSRIHFKEPLPVIIRGTSLLEPTDNLGNIEFDHVEAIVISCENTGPIVHTATKQQLNTATVICEGGDYFKNEDWLLNPVRFSEFQCITPPDYSSKKTDRRCYDNNPIFEVGYTVQNIFYPVYESCFNEYGLNAIYSKYTQKPYNAFYQTKVDRPYFIANDVYGFVPVETLFSPRGQKAAVSKVIGSITDNYFSKTELLSRGHLAAKTDFVFAFGERASFHYVNCAPQWTGFNGGNWNTLEVDLRNHVHAAGYNTIIYTGTFGVSSLQNQYGRRVDLYLYSDENNNPVIPIPEFFYKVVYDLNSKCGIAYVGINNPYYTNAEARQMFFCNDVCRKNNNFSWLTWNPDDPHLGFAFCCAVSDFRDTVPHLPFFEVNCLLT